MQHLTSINNFTKEQLWELIKLTGEIKADPAKYNNHLSGKILATLFFEPSTRTRLSFESAALRLGMKVLGFADASTSSTKKGETLEDTIKIINGFADAIAMRHFETNAAARAAKVSRIPVINGGDGINEHPTQALLDIFTINEHRQLHAEKLTIAFVGDLKYGRTVHSLSQGLAHFDPKYYFISPSVLKLPDEIKQKLNDKNIEFDELETWDEIAGQVDVLYMTRVQKERFEDESKYELLKESYLLNPDTASKFNDQCLFMHPLPRVGEIDPALDDDLRAIYFDEAHNGVWMRMAILLRIMNHES